MRVELVERVLVAVSVIRRHLVVAEGNQGYLSAGEQSGRQAAAWHIHPNHGGKGALPFGQLHLGGQGQRPTLVAYHNGQQPIGELSRHTVGVNHRPFPDFVVLDLPGNFSPAAAPILELGGPGLGRLLPVEGISSRPHEGIGQGSHHRQLLQRRHNWFWIGGTRILHRIHQRNGLGSHSGGTRKG